MRKLLLLIVPAVAALVWVLAACAPFYGGETDIGRIACRVRGGDYLDNAGRGDCVGVTIGADACITVLSIDPRIGQQTAESACTYVTSLHTPGQWGSI